jgi:hypothetical protein
MHSSVIPCEEVILRSRKCIISAFHAAVTIFLRGKKVELSNKIRGTIKMACTLGVQTFLPPLAAQAWWLPLRGEDLAVAIANYNTIAGNGCLDGRIYTTRSGALKTFTHKASTSAILRSDIEDLLVVLGEIMLKVKRYIIDARETFVRGESVGFGFIQPGQSIGVLLANLGRMTLEQVDQNKEKIAALTKTEREFVREHCAAFCASENLRVVILCEKTGYKKKVLTSLTQPQRDWSGNALYASCMEYTKEVHKRINKSILKGTAKASVKKRMKVDVDSDETPAERAKKRLKMPIQTIGIDGHHTSEDSMDLLLPQIRSILDGHPQIRSILDGHPDLWSQIEAIARKKKGELCVPAWLFALLHSCCYLTN